MKRLILASGSPRRHELLAEAGFTFEVIPSPAEELHDASIPLTELCSINAKLKAQEIAQQYSDAVVLGADTLVYVDETPLGKPISQEDAVAMLKKLSGRKHEVCTGMCLIEGERVEMFHKVTEVYFKDLTDEVIEEYMSLVNVMDKAGSYGIQEHGDMIVEKVKGSYNNVVGLPVKAVKKKLKSFDVFCVPKPKEMKEIDEDYRYPLLFNPNARSKRGRRSLRFLMSRATDFVLYATRDIDDARALATKFAKRGEPVVLAAGGDGTLNAVVQGLVGSETALGVLPSGTMNVFARELGIPVPGKFKGQNLPKALEVIKNGHISEVDLFRVNGQPFVQMAGVGFDAQVIEDTTVESKKLLGPLAYLVSAVKLLGDNPPKMKVVTDDGEEVEGIAVLAGNGELYGGQIRLFPQADNADGLLDILVFKKAGYQFVMDSLKGMAGVLDLLGSSVEYLQASSFKVVAEGDVPIEVDGEYVGRATEAAFSSTEHKLRVLTPHVEKNEQKDWAKNIPRKLAGGDKKH